MAQEKGVTTMKRWPAVLIAGFWLIFPGIGTGAPLRAGQPRPEAALQASSGREKLLLDFGWRFHLGDICSVEGDQGYGSGEAFAKAGEAYGAVKPDFDDSAWRTLDLPHDWAVELEFVNVQSDAVKDHGFKPVGRQFPKTSIGWYRRTLTVPKSDEGRRLAVQFDGVFRGSTVWMNGHYLGQNLSGYSEFGYDITDYVQFGQKNVLVVRVDASQYEGWFYEGAGIYRHVWLVKHAPLHIPQYGVFVAPKVEGQTARVDIETKVGNEQASEVRFAVSSVVLDEKGRTVADVASEILTLDGYGQKTVRQRVEVANPLLWSLEAPHLYKLVSLVNSGNATADRTETMFGIRTVRFDKDNGFFLNGKRVEIQGVCCHQDHAGVGSALPDRLQEYRIERLKEMGVNAYRTSHNPPTPELLDACDRLGMLVMDENRLMGSSPELVGEFATLVRRDRNHPSVIIWSLGNEEWVIQGTVVGKRIAQTLKRVQEELDPTRLCTYAGNNGTEYEGINSVVDVRGINYISAGSPDAYHRDHPGQAVWGSEEASTLSTRGIYVNDKENGFMSDYDLNAPDWGSIAEKSWTYYAARPWLAGAFVWTGFDYRGEPTPYSWPCINSHFGIMDTCGFPKNNYFYYQSWWSDKDVLHIAPHWNWEGKEGQAIDVWCQSNCDTVELLLNGKSLGRKTMKPNSHLEWKVAYAPGVLEARGVRKGRTIVMKVETTGAPAAIHLEPDRVVIRADGEDISVVNVSIRDARGREVPVADNLVTFEVSGGGRIIGVGNGNPSSHEPDKCLPGAWQRRAFNGRCQLILQSGREPGVIALKASADGLKTETAAIRAEKSQPRPFVEK
jgi:beta-galactosidase